MDTRRYFLEKDIYLCTAGDSTVLLSLKSDKYIGLDGRQTTALRALVRGWPSAQTGVGDTPALAPEALSFADKLVRNRILTSDERSGKCATPASHPAPAHALPEHLVDGSENQHPQDVANVLRSYLKSRTLLNFLPLARVVESVRKLKQKQRSSMQPTDLSSLLTLAAAFRRAKYLIYSPKDQCLLDSLALIYFLARHQQLPTWIVGVRPNPFAAHSWVQHETYVLNDTPDVVRTFHPILTV